MRFQLGSLLAKLGDDNIIIIAVIAAAIVMILVVCIVLLVICRRKRADDKCKPLPPHPFLLGLVSLHRLMQMSGSSLLVLLFTARLYASYQKIV